MDGDSVEVDLEFITEAIEFCLRVVLAGYSIGKLWRVSTEFLLLGIRGNCPFLDKSQMNWIESEREECSTKPEVIRELIEKVSPSPRLELFARRGIEGWTCWVNEM